MAIQLDEIFFLNFLKTTQAYSSADTDSSNKKEDKKAKMNSHFTLGAFFNQQL